jgi:hypothetical protein
MRRLAVTIAAATVFVVGAPIMGAGAMVAPGAIRGAADSLNVVERAQFVWLGHNYCWYDDGWNGPGWYWCNQYTSPGIGWGGGYGWHHWRGGHPGGRPGGHPGGAPVGGHPAVATLAVIALAVIPVATLAVLPAAVIRAAVIRAAVIRAAVIRAAVIRAVVIRAVVIPVEVMDIIDICLQQNIVPVL